MTQLELEHALEIAKNAAIRSGVQLKKFYGNIDEFYKGSGDSVGGIVTELDQKTEKFLEAELAKFSPNVGFRGEEYGIRSHKDIMWLVDPIDGTAHYVRGLPFCTTMIALIENNEVILSVIHDFVRDDLYWAVRGQGAYCNDKRISVGERSLTQSIISFETTLDKHENYKKYLALRDKANIIATINCGFEFAMIASGKLDGRIGLDPYGMDWDYAPGSLLVTEAGGVATNIGIHTYGYKNHDYIIANKTVHAELTNGDNAIFPVI